MNPAGFLALSSLVILFSGPAHALFSYDIAVAQDGHYRVAYEQFEGLDRDVPVSDLSLFEQGSAVRLEINDGGDGLFGSGDSIQFVGRRLAGKRSWYNEFSRYNIYQLHVGRKPAPSAASGLSHAGKGVIVEHLEQDNLRVALAHASEPETAEHWYWQRITPGDSGAFSRQLSWAEPPSALRIALRGLSHDEQASAAGMPQHKVAVYLDGNLLSESSWDGQESHVIEVDHSYLSGLDESAASLELHIPERVIPGSGLQLVDAVLLNWIELEYSAPGSALATIPEREGGRQLKVAPGWQRPEWVETSPIHSGLARPDQQADYLMISHGSLTEALAPLAELHRARGLAVKVVDVRSVFNEFGHGLATPEAIRAFIQHAWHYWARPAPQMVLLVGDASWGREAYASVSRNLVPTFQVRVRGQLAASDNGLVSVDGDDWRPDLAIGRLPAGNAQELSAMVKKLVAHAMLSPGRDWQHRTAWVAGSETQFQETSSKVAELARAKGVQTELIFPGEPSATGGQSGVVDAFNRGNALVHFLGHGGRFVWRTGPPDLRGASDLFSLETIASLDAGHPLPMVLSMTCSSGPFDHPTAQSLAESFLTTPDKGAMAVLAASWRIPPSERFSGMLVEGLLQPGYPIGMAVMEAKQRERRRDLVESYNLLGDPALSIFPEAPR